MILCLCLYVPGTLYVHRQKRFLYPLDLQMVVTFHEGVNPQSWDPSLL